MITSIKITRFRGIREGKLEDLTPLVILVGPNGCGKSSILEAIMASASPAPVNAIDSVVGRRKISGGEPWAWLVWKRGSEGDALLESQTSNGALCVRFGPSNHKRSKDETRGLNSSHTNNLSFYWSPRETTIPAPLFVDPNQTDNLAELYSELGRTGGRSQQQEADAVLGAVMPSLKGLQVYSERNTPVLYVTFEHHAVPAVLRRDGLRTLLKILLELMKPLQAPALLEEPEIHQHPAAIRQSARIMLGAVRRDIQVIVTTHSLELIDAIVAEATDEDRQRLSLYRLSLEDGLLKSSRLEGKSVAFERDQIKEDLR